MRPLDELDLGHELRLDPVDVPRAHPRHLRRLGERGRIALERAQEPEQALDLLLAEPGADVADPAELVPVPDREDERAEGAGATALAARVAGDDELLAPGRLHLEPRPAALPGLVAGVGPLRDDPLELLLLRGREERLAVLERLGQAHRAAGRVEQLREALAPLRERQVEERDAVGLEHVEDVEQLRARRPAASRRSWRARCRRASRPRRRGPRSASARRAGGRAATVGEALGQRVPAAREEGRLAASTYATTRYPSHLTSCSHPFPRGTSFASVASIGS